MVEVVRIKHRGVRATPVARTEKPAPATKRPMSRIEIADAIADIKQRVRRMRPPLNQNPEAFHEDKSDVGKRIERLEDAVRRDEPLRSF